MSAETAGLKIMSATFDGGALGIVQNVRFNKAADNRPLSDLGKDRITVLPSVRKVATISIAAVRSSDVTLPELDDKGTVAVSVKDASGNTDSQSYVNMQVTAVNEDIANDEYGAVGIELTHVAGPDDEGPES
jgi:hypothetical protein